MIELIQKICREKDAHCHGCPFLSDHLTSKNSRCMFIGIPEGWDIEEIKKAFCGADMRDDKKEIEYRVMIKEKSQCNYRLYRVLNNKQDAEDLCNVLQSDNISAKINKKKITKKKEQE